LIYAWLLFHSGYPIEVAIVDCQSTACTSWLIRPTEEWHVTGIWSEEASNVHKIALSDVMARGQPAEKVARQLLATCVTKIGRIEGRSAANVTLVSRIGCPDVADSQLHVLGQSTRLDTTG
jgi:hypothetical protein